MPNAGRKPIVTQITFCFYFAPELEIGRPGINSMCAFINLGAVQVETLL